jgi:hypothetical protein
MLRTGWVVVRRMTSPSPKSMARVVAAHAGPQRKARRLRFAQSTRGVQAGTALQLYALALAIR